jgi:hypothetical protein
VSVFSGAWSTTEASASTVGRRRGGRTCSSLAGARALEVSSPAMPHELGILAPEGFLGLHVLQLFSFPSGDPAEFERLEPRDYAGLEHMRWFQKVGGYNTMNASRPQTVAARLSDSPIGMPAYGELFNSFGNGTSLVPLETILTEVSVNWFANAAAGMARSYFDGRRRVRATPRRPPPCRSKPAPCDRCRPHTTGSEAMP